MSFNIAELAAFATSNNNSKPASKAVHMLSVEDARERVVVKDGNKKDPEDGSQALTLVLGKYVLDLDEVFGKNATRVNTPADKVEEWTEGLLSAVAEGKFDEAIKAAQAKAKVTAEKASAPKVTAEVDLDALEEEETEYETSEEFEELDEDEL